MRLQGKVTLITGGSRGIGKAIAECFLREGSCVAIVARTPKELERTTADLCSIGRITAFSGDISERTQVEELLDMTLDAFGKVDVLVNNAAVQSPIGPLKESNPEEWLQTVKVNLFGTYLCCRMAIPRMVERGSGKIINLSGGGGSTAKPFFSAYAASKAAVVRLTETLAEELRGSNVQVNAIDPGAVNTRMTEEVIRAGESAGESAIKQAQKQLEGDATPPQVVASLALFLASEDSNGLTGKLISAAYDEWEAWENYLSQINNSELFTLRRLDPYNIRKLVPQWTPPWKKQVNS